jgi:hypothetical protein
MPNRCKLSLPLLLLLLLLLHAAAANFFAASDPAFSAVGRTQANPDGSQSFDWEGGSPYCFTVSHAAHLLSHGRLIARRRVVLLQRHGRDLCLRCCCTLIIDLERALASSPRASSPSYCVLQQQCHAPPRPLRHRFSRLDPPQKQNPNPR